MNNELHPLEIERKFLVASDNLPVNLTAYPQKRIHQGYIVANEEIGVRLRLKGELCYITVKSGQGITRSEREGLISRDTFDELWPTTNGQRVEKVRYELPGPNGLTFELDIYEGHLHGLITVEAEFDSIGDAERFQPPDWFGLDVTDDLRYTNSCLAKEGIPAR
ncbi:MAG: CYTH domain-containing protein [Chloroflexota bacterium]